ncbi:putative membrane protein YdzA [Paenibacillus sp. CCS19]|uniref:DUF3817 domain-containing protein n=1 Tax=Paenibacillus sp. CCS19 TaxID=3158387 RepID=UPI00256E291C|nr:DUF3817 domain-containing protein [Paenibacillus cellulosilyticus]GMK37311.1 putative membrane protein YdzA [Paenibacillus cellulosilyticus]
MQQTSLRLFTWISYLEGLSFLTLLCIAMPLKYMADRPEFVTIVGIIHGFLFALYLLAIAGMAIRFRWRLLRVIGGIIAAFLPFGPFLFDRRIKRD